MIKYLFFLLPFFKQEKIKIAVIGDSYCVGAFTPYVDSLMDRPEGYRYQLNQWFKNWYDTVETMRGCSGGETIKSAMPNRYPGSKPGYNIDSALNWGADLIVIQYAGNHFMNGIPLDTVKWCYKKIYDTLTLLGKSFIFISNTARKVSLGSATPYTKFQDSVKAINRYIDSLNNYRYANTFDTTYDPVTNKPIWELLGSDSLHPNATGYAHYLGGIQLNSPVIDSLAGFDTVRVYNLQFTDLGDSIRIGFQASKVKDVLIASSNDNTAWTQIARMYYKEGGYSVTVLKTNYIRILARRYRKVITLTKTFL